MVISFEVSGPVQWKAGWFSSRVNGRRYWRMWWLLFAVSYYSGSADELSRHSKGWVYQTGVE